VTRANHQFTFSLTIGKDTLSFSTYDQPCKGYACKGSDLRAGGLPTLPYSRRRRHMQRKLLRRKLLLRKLRLRKLHEQVAA
jgi:hypothetical protein